MCPSTIKIELLVEEHCGAAFPSLSSRFLTCGHKSEMSTLSVLRTFCTVVRRAWPPLLFSVSASSYEENRLNKMCRLTLLTTKVRLQQSGRRDITRGKFPQSLAVLSIFRQNILIMITCSLYVRPPILKYEQESSADCLII